MHAHRGRLAFLVVVAAACVTQVSAPSWAEEMSSDVATAESLFHEARSLVERGEHERACKAFEASLRLERAVGTLLNLARCYEHTGRIATAWSTFAEAEGEAQRAQQPKRAALARQHKARLAPLVPRVVISVSGAPSGVRVQLDDKLLGQGALDLPLAIDPGRHRIRLEKRGHEPLTQEFEVPAPQIENAPPVVIELGPFVASSKRPSAVPEERGQLRGTDRPPARARESNELGLVGGIVTGVGLAGVGVGVGLALHAVSEAESADCDEDLICSSEGLAARRDAQSLLTVGYVVGIAGGVVAAAGITVLAISLSRDVALRADVSGAGSLGLRAVGLF